MPKNAYAVIMAGGRGERFWPLSTSRRPKQLLTLFGGKPLLTAAVERLAGLIPQDHIFIITSADLVAAVHDAVPSLPRDGVVGEPFGRDTAAAIALGAVLVKSRDPGGVFCVLTADQLIGDIEIFRATLTECFACCASRDALLTIGIKPGSPSTAFGYIEAGQALKHSHDVEILAVKRFVEKPGQKTAEEYVRAGNFYWNSGMFIWSVESIEKALLEHQPALFEMTRRLARVVGTVAFPAALEKEYGALDKISIDYAVMEKASNIVMAKGTFSWDDVGSWSSIGSHFEGDADGNVVLGSCERLDAAGNIVVSEGRLTALIGVKDMIVVQAEGATLVCPRDRAQDVKKMVEQLRKERKYSHLL